MKKIMHSLAMATLTALVASPALAQWVRQDPDRRAPAAQSEDDGRGIMLGLRGAWGTPMGSLGASQEIGSVTNGCPA